MSRAGTCNDVAGSHACDLPDGHSPGLHLCIGRFDGEYADRDEFWNGSVFVGPPPPEGWIVPDNCCAAWDDDGVRFPRGPVARRTR